MGKSSKDGRRSLGLDDKESSGLNAFVSKKDSESKKPCEDGLHAALREQIFGSSNLFEESPPLSVSVQSLPENLSKSPAAVSPHSEGGREIYLLLSACSQGEEAQRMEALLSIGDLLELENTTISLNQMEDLRISLVDRFWNERAPSLQSCIIRLLTLLAGLVMSREVNPDTVVRLDEEGDKGEIRIEGEPKAVRSETGCAVLILNELLRILSMESQEMGETFYMEKHSAGDDKQFEVPEISEPYGNADVICQTLWSVRTIMQLRIQVDLVTLFPVIKLLDCNNFSVRQLSIQLLQEAVSQPDGSPKKGLIYSPQAEYLAGKLQAFVKDSSPTVKIAALEAVRNLCLSGAVFSQNYYELAVALLGDSFAGVRLAALKLVAAWGRFVANENDGPSSDVDEAFLHVCSMATDMEMSVRKASFMELGAMAGAQVSDSILLQALSKRIAKTTGPSSSSPSLPRDTTELLATEDGEGKRVLLESFAAGAFIHGLEDEFWEVRTETLAALTALCRWSKVLADPATILIVDCINDDNGGVRMRAMEALAGVAEKHHLVLKDDQLQTVRAVVDDSSREMRRLCRSLLGSLRIVKRSALHSTVQALLGSLKGRPKDEEMETLEALALIGRVHSNLVECVGQDFIHQAMVLFKGEGVSDPNYRGLLVLLASACHSGGILNSILPQSVWDHLYLLKHKLPSSTCVFVENKFFWNQACKRPRIWRQMATAGGGGGGGGGDFATGSTQYCLDNSVNLKRSD